MKMFGVYGGWIYIFDGIQELPVRTIKTPESIMGLGLSPDADYILCGTTQNDGPGCIHMYKFDTGEFLRRFEGHEGSVSCFSFLESGCFVSGSDDDDLRVWNPKTGDCVCVMNDTNSTWQMDVLIDGFRIIVSSWDRNNYNPRIWNTQTLERETVLEGINVFRMKVSRTTGLIAILDHDNAVHVYSPDTTVCFQVLHATLDLRSLCFSFDGRSIICGNERGITKMTMNETEFTIENIEYRTDMRNDVLELPDGRILAFDDDSIVLTEIKPSMRPLTSTSIRREFEGNMSDLFLIPESPILL
jgi:WD40 repeat protein